MLSPASGKPSAVGGSDAITFMSGSTAALGIITPPGITTTGSSPGCQRSMLSAEPPNEELPKNRLAVLKEKPSCDGDGAITIDAASGPPSRWSSGRDSSDIATSYCGSGGAFSASTSSGSSGG